MGVNERIVLTTLLYADIFDYPLTKDQLWMFAIGEEISQSATEHALNKLKAKIYHRDGYIVLKNRRHLIDIRKKKAGIYKEKYTKAVRASRILSYIPTILFVGLSGSCAMENADNEADIDFIIITKQNTMWLTRLFSIFALELVKMRRRRSEKKQDGICLNLFFDERDIRLDKDLYIAHEIVQVKPLVNKNNTYEKFLKQNIWVKEYLPNSVGQVLHSFSVNRSSVHLGILENIARKIQIWYMGRHRTREVITDTRAFFHPYDYRQFVLTEFEKRKKTYAI